MNLNNQESSSRLRLHGKETLLRIVTIVVSLVFVVLFAVSAMAQRVDIIVDAGANVGEVSSEEDTQSSTDNPPTLDLEAGVAESQPQPQAGPQGPAGERGQDGRNGAPGRSGRSGRNGRDGRDGRPGRDADLKKVSQLVQAGDAKVEKVAKTYTDQQVGNERAQRIAADAKKRKDKKDMILGIIGGAIGTLFVLLVVALLFRQPIVAAMVRPTVAPPAAVPAAPRQTGQTAAQDAGAMLEEYGAPGAPFDEESADIEQVGGQRDYVYDDEGRIVRRAGKKWRIRPCRTGSVMPSGEPCGGNAVALAVSGMPTGREEADPTSTGAPTKECVIETKSPEVTAAIADAKPTATEESKEEPAKAEAEEV